MGKQPAKKRGRPRKLVVEVCLSDAYVRWEPRLRRSKSPALKIKKYEVSEQALPPVNRDPSGRRIRSTANVYGESMDHQSATQQTDVLLSSLYEEASDESVSLPAAWQRYLECMDVVAEELSPSDKGAALKRLALEDARSRRHTKPPEFPSEIGSPQEFRERLAGHEFEVRTRLTRREQVILIRVYQLPPHENEDLDPLDHPAGHWEGLTFVPDPSGE
jgi:hypothetical protein